eukprot:gene6694-9183_t
MQTNSLISNIKVTLKATVAPTSSSNPLQSVKAQIHQLLFKYNETLNAIPLSYTSLEFPKDKKYARILGDQPWLHIDIVTNFVAFTPTIGKTVIGKIKKVSDSYIAILVLGMFNASIGSEELRKVYTFDSSNQTWNSSSKSLKSDDFVEFIIVSCQHKSGVINITGKLPPAAPENKKRKAGD